MPSSSILTFLGMSDRLRKLLEMIFLFLGEVGWVLMTSEVDLRMPARAFFVDRSPCININAW